MTRSKTLRNILIGVGAVLTVALLGLIASVAVPIALVAPPIDGMKLPGGATLVVSGGSNVYIVPNTPGTVLLVDCGGDPKMTAVAAALKKSGLGLNAVTAVLITHAHADHIAGCPALPHAAFFAQGREAAAVVGDEVIPNFLNTITFAKPKPTGLTVARELMPNDAGHIGNLGVIAFAVSGHTPGSGAYLINNVLYAGDAAVFSRSGSAMRGPWIFDTDRAQAAASIKLLATELAPLKIAAVATGHTAPGQLSALK